MANNNFLELLKEILSKPAFILRFDAFCGNLNNSAFSPKKQLCSGAFLFFKNDTVYN